MIVIEVEENPNCEPMDMRVFHDLAPAREVAKVRLEREQGKFYWYEVVSWNDEDQPGVAKVQKVDDSGDGVAYLVHGGTRGLRLRPDGDSAAWSLKAENQWGEPLLLIGDESDLELRS